ncbi:MFS transporter [Salmonella enterica]|nr:MFS transporter [Salmonella enterica]
MKRKTMGWLIVFLLFIVYMLNYMDRSALSITAPLIEKELGFNAAEMGMIFSAFFIGYALFNFIGGWASDKVGPKTVFLIAALLWSVFCGLTGLVTGLWTMLIVRVLFGMAEGPVSAAGNKIINNWISRKESATAIGIFSAGSPLGGAVSGPIVGLLALSLGWRPAFGIIFLFGLVWVLLWYFIVSDKPTMSKRLAPEERIDFENHEDVILSDDGRATPSLGYYMKQPMVWATTLAFFSYNYILFFFLTWFPSYLNHSLHLDIKEISIATVIPWVIGAIGMVLGGVCSDVIYRITGNALLSRRLILGVCLAGAAVCVAVSGTVSTIGSAIVEERLRYAQKLGVPYVLNAADDQVIDAIKNITHGTMAQVVIEASGANSAIRNTLDLASFAGRISFTGWPKQETSLPTNLITYKELDLRGSRTSAGEFDEALRMLSTLEINPQDVVSKVVNLDEIPDAVKELDRYPERYLKINAVFH